MSITKWSRFRFAAMTIGKAIGRTPRREVFQKLTILFIWMTSLKYIERGGALNRLPSTRWSSGWPRLDPSARAGKNGLGSYRRDPSRWR
jgi:hypothetical protein